MTLKNRNSFIKVFLLSSLILFLFMLATLIYSIATKNILVPPAIRLPDFFDHIPFLRNSFLAVMLSFSIIFIYIPISFFLLIKYFENTQTSEIIFFTGFLIACMAESARFLSICLGLWQSFSDILIFAGKVVLFGRSPFQRDKPKTGCRTQLHHHDDSFSCFCDNHSDEHGKNCFDRSCNGRIYGSYQHFQAPAFCDNNLIIFGSGNKKEQPRTQTSCLIIFPADSRIFNDCKLRYICLSYIGNSRLSFWNIPLSLFYSQDVYVELS